MTVLRGIFEPQGISVPTPLQVSYRAFAAADTVPCHCTRSMCQGWHVTVYHGGSLQHAEQGRLHCIPDIHQTYPSCVMGILRWTVSVLLASCTHFLASLLLCCLVPRLSNTLWYALSGGINLAHKVMLTSQSSLSAWCSSLIASAQYHSMLSILSHCAVGCLSTLSCISVDRHVAPDGARTPWCMAPTAAWA